MSTPAGVPSIDVRGAASAAEDADRALIVDVREPNEFAATRIAGVALLPISVLPQRHSELPKDRPLLMICRSGARSAAATSFLIQNGWPDVRNVEGGMIAWQAAGLPVLSGVPDPGEGDLPA